MAQHLKLTQSLSESFGRAPVAVDHSIREHDLLTVESLARLAETLPAGNVEHNEGDLSIVSGSDVARSAMPVGEIARTIESNGQWMVLKWIETVGEYKAMLDELLDEVEEAIPAENGPMLQREGFIFLSAPGSVTPAHTDPEHNILLQIRGRKEMNVGDFPDEKTRQIRLEDDAMGAHRNLDWQPIEPQLFDLGPGDAVYVPPHAPHWVKNGAEPSISLSITFRTPATIQAARVSSINARLRRVGLSPRPPGKRPAVDAVKASLSGRLSRIRR